MPRKPKCWKWTTGSYGATVKAFERTPGGPLYLGIPDPKGGYRRLSLGHTDKNRAMREAAELAAKRQAGTGRGGPLTLASMLSIYMRAVDGKQSKVHHNRTLRAVEAWTRYLGADYHIEKFGVAQWDAFARLRSSGEIDARGRPVTESTKREPCGLRWLPAT